MAMHIRCTSSPKRPDQLWSHPASCTMDTIGCPPGVSRPKRQAGHVPPSGAEAESGWSLPLLPYMPSCPTQGQLVCRRQITLKSHSFHVCMGSVIAAAHSSSKFSDVFSVAAISHRGLSSLAGSVLELLVEKRCEYDLFCADELVPEFREDSQFLHYYKAVSAYWVKLYVHINTFTAIVDLSRFNNSRLKSPASTLVDLTFQSRALRSFSLNQLRNLSL